MINLFNLPNYKIDTSKFSHLLHDKIVSEFENNFCDYVGAKYGCTINSATNAIFLTFLNKNITVDVPSMIPPVVCNALMTSGNKVNFVDNFEWIGNSYVLHDFGEYKVIDSAQRVDRDQFKLEANDNDLMFFSFYPTKPIGSCDGGIIVSNDKKKIEWFKQACLNGMSYSTNNWERKIKFPGYKMYMNSIQAYIANKNLEKLDKKKEKLKKIRDKYNKKLGYNNTSYHLYCIFVNNNKKFIEYMKEQKVNCGLHYEALHENKIYNTNQNNCPKSSEISKKIVSIPFHENMTLKEVEFVIKCVKIYKEKNDDK
jgi:dTDP-4-amino-4,6-dideoxygalactose transaminase